MTIAVAFPTAHGAGSVHVARCSADDLGFFGVEDHQRRGSAAVGHGYDATGQHRGVGCTLQSADPVHDGATAADRVEGHPYDTPTAAATPPPSRLVNATDCPVRSGA